MGSNSEFKLKDRVICIDEGQRGGGWQLGKEFVIGYISMTDRGKVAWPDVNSSGVYFDSLKLVESFYDFGDDSYRVQFGK